MKIKGLTLEQFTACTVRVSEDRYEGNIAVQGDARDTSGPRKGGACQARLEARNSRGPGSRKSWTGRLGPYACWHAYRDVLTLAFSLQPDAVIETGMALYRGKTGFEDAYPATAFRNVGSQLLPSTMPELCACEAPGTFRYLPPAEAVGISSEIIADATRSYNEIADLLEEDHIDSLVFGPDYWPGGRGGRAPAGGA